SYRFPDYSEATNDNLSNMNGTINNGIMVYDIIKGERTYQYLPSAPLYSFGYGLSYGQFEYSNVAVTAINDGKFTVSGKVKNIGSKTSDEVVQIYSAFAGDVSRIKQPIKKLIAYERLHDIAVSNDERDFSFEIDLKDKLGVWDVESGDYVVEAGVYVITAGGSSADADNIDDGNNDIALTVDAGDGVNNGVNLITTKRDLKKLTLAENLDDYSEKGKQVDDIETVSASIAYKSNTAIQFRKDGAWISFKNVDFTSVPAHLTVQAGSDRTGSLKVYALPTDGDPDTALTIIATIPLTDTRPGSLATGLGIGPAGVYPGNVDGQTYKDAYVKPAWKKYGVAVSAVAGTYDIYIETEKRGAVLEWFQFDAPETATDIAIDQLYSLDSIREKSGALTLSANLTPVTALDTLTWGVANKSGTGAALAAINAAGELTATGAGNGTVTVTAAAGSQSATKDILITNQLDSNKVTVNNQNLTVDYLLLRTGAAFGANDNISRWRGTNQQTAVFLAPERVNLGGTYFAYALPGAGYTTLPASELNWAVYASDGTSPTTLATIDQAGLLTAAGTENGDVVVTATLKNNPDIFATRKILLQNQGDKNGRKMIQAENWDTATAGSNGNPATAYAVGGNEMGLYQSTAVTAAADRAVLGYKKVDFGTNAGTFQIRLANTANSILELWINGPDTAVGGTKIGQTNVPAGTYEQYKTIALPITQTSGVHDLYLVTTATVPGATLTNRLNYFQFFPLDGGDSADTYTVTFHTGGGTPVPATQVVAKGERAVAPVSAPTLAGFVFDGWYTDSSFTDIWVIDAAVDANVDVYAKWIYEDAFVVDPALTAPSRAGYPNGVASTLALSGTGNQNFTMDNTIQTGTAWYYTLNGVQPTKAATALPANRMISIPFSAFSGGKVTVKVVAYHAQQQKYSQTYTHTLNARLAAPASSWSSPEPYLPATSNAATITAVANTEVYYTITTDGNEPAVPTTSSTKYTTPIPFSAAVTRVKAIRVPVEGSAYVTAGVANSDVAELIFKVNTNLRSLNELKTGTWTPEERKALVNAVVSQLTLDEKIQMLGGTSGSAADATAKKASASAGGTYTTPRLKTMGIAPMSLSDGPAGVNFGSGGTQSKATAWASPTALASTWNKEAMAKVGEQTGKEAAYYGVDFMLAPAHDLIRNPLSGRNFEYFSEDPHLSGKTAAAYTIGLQSQGVGATLKHYAGNEQESFGNGGSSAGINYDGNSGGGNVIASERALREIYLKSFEIPVKEAHPWSVMSSYNRVNDVHATNNPWLLTDVLRGDWGFDGFVVSDWGAVHDGALSVLAQMDLAEGSLSATWKNRIRDAVLANKTDTKDPVYPTLTEEIVDRSIANILNVMTQTNIFKGEYGDWGVPYDLTAKHNGFYGSDLAEESNDVATETAGEAIILLKNSENLLPLREADKVGLVTSPNLKYYAGWGGTLTATEDFVIRGAGSSGVYVGEANPGDSHYDDGAHIPSFTKVLSDSGKLAGAVQDIYEAAGRTKTVTYNYNAATGKTTGETRTYTDLPDAPAVDANLEAAAGAMAGSDASHGIMIISRQTGEGYDNIPAAVAESTVYDTSTAATGNTTQISKGYYLSAVEEKALKAYADALHAAGKKFIVLLNVGAAIDTTVINQYADAILVVWYPGQNGARVMADVLYGAVNPSGKTTQTFLKSFAYSPSVAASIALKETGVARSNNPDNPLYFKTAIREALEGSGLDVNGGWGSSPVFYDEGVLVGYRWFDTKFQTKAAYDEQVAYPFGFGLSYTQFEFSNLRLDSSVFDAEDPDATVTATVSVKNVGTVTGKEVVQLYLGMHDYASEGRPMKDLRGYEKIELAPGESKDVSFTIQLSDLQYFDDGQPADKVLSGSYSMYDHNPTISTNVTYGEGDGWTVTLGSVFDVIVGDTSDNFDLAEYGVKSSFTYTGANQALYSVTYDLNGGTGTPVTDSAQYTPGASVTVKAIGDATKPDYTFAGWNTAADGSGISYQPAVTFLISANTTLYAQWRQTGGGGTTSGGSTATTYTVTFNSQGGSAVATQSVARGGVVTKPADPTREDHTFAGWHTDAAGTFAYNFSSAVTVSFTLYAKWTEGGSGEGEDGPASFPDAAQISDWARPYVEKLVTAGVIAGRNDGRFDPKGNVTRAEFTKMIVLGLGLVSGETAKTFTDVGGSDWFKEFVDIASSHSVVQGVSETAFAPNRTITRQDLCTIVYRALDALGVAVPASDGNSFPDAGQISGYAADAVQAMKQLDIVSGRGSGQFDPRAFATREETAKIVSLVIDFVAKQSSPAGDR
ncbi:MAG: InlB B-repeat-containing protein, partial [Oscillospiraceae bacterium]|nr:InlB B-repeat-containing protein [Oscillospiraceae bacterium]